MLEIGSPTHPKVLIVDDEAEVLQSLADLLRKDFHVIATSDIEEALALASAQNPFSLVISDQRMPVQSGVEFLSRLSKICPDTARILLTGYADIEVVIEAVNSGQIVQYITKPWDGGRLVGMLRPIAERHRLLLDNRRLIQQLAELTRSMAVSDLLLDSLEGTHAQALREHEILKTAHERLQNSFWHLEKIQEVLPICMACGKVKTSEASWEEVIQYLKNNSKFLSHGYCPDCLERVKGQWLKP